MNGVMLNWSVDPILSLGFPDLTLPFLIRCPHFYRSLVLELTGQRSLVARGAEGPPLIGG
jgi:hypothetical protein